MHSIQDVNPVLYLAVKQLNIGLPQQTLLEALSFDLHAGETIAIVGESGSGKSISSLALLGLLPKELKVQGQAHFKGQDLLRCNEAELRQIRGRKAPSLSA